MANPEDIQDQSLQRGHGWLVKEVSLQKALLEPEAIAMIVSQYSNNNWKAITHRSSSSCFEDPTLFKHSASLMLTTPAKHMEKSKVSVPRCIMLGLVTLLRTCF
jgi:hypothetical protein